jgi:C-terminal processing protease CtpA/Prc
MRLVLALSLAVVLALQESRWTLGGTPGGRFVIVSAAGSVVDRTGATLVLRSDSAPPGAFGTISGSVPADSFRSRRVRLIADVDAKDVAGSASPWLRVDGPTGMLSLDNGTDNPVRGNASGHRELTLFVPPEATRLVFGLLMSGRGEATARGLHLEARSIVAADAPLAPAAQRELDSAFAIVRARSLWRDTVSWTRVEPRVRAIAAGAESPDEVYPAIRVLLASLGDHHSFLMRPAGMRQFQTGGAQNPRPEIRALADSIGYISVPAYSGAERSALEAYVKDVHAALGAVLPNTSCRWVVDLRGNGGGNMWPMLGGLRPFLGEAGLGSFVSASGPAPLWHARDLIDLQMTPALTALDSSYVAVLTGPRTASSGEAVTISFIGRPRTRSFGLATAGLSTANSGFLLPDSSMIQLTVSVEADRNGRRYGEKIEPDETIPGSLIEGADPQMDRAIAWLKSQPACGK